MHGQYTSQFVQPAISSLEAETGTVFCVTLLVCSLQLAVNWLTVRLTVRLTYRQTDCQTDWLSDWLTVRLTVSLLWQTARFTSKVSKFFPVSAEMIRSAKCDWCGVRTISESHLNSVRQTNRHGRSVEPDLIVVSVLKYTVCLSVFV
jgi:hypothetical protein